MKKNTVKINESQLRNLIAENVKKVLKEYYEEPIYGDYFTVLVGTTSTYNVEKENVETYEEAIEIVRDAKEHGCKYTEIIPRHRDYNV